MIENNLNNSQMDNSKTSNNARAILINVDDLGLSNVVNEAVIDLAELGRIGASSYMVGGTITDSEIKKLAALKVDIGLHLDLTGIFRSELQGSLKAIIIASYLRRLNPTQVTEIIRQQLDSFEDRFGRAPVFVDGHQHIHQFPVIRHCLAQELDTRYGQGPTNTVSARITTPLINDFKSWIIYALGGHAWRGLCKKYHITTNDQFAGVYGFDANVQQLAKLWQAWLSSAPHTPHLIPALYTLLSNTEALGTYQQYAATTPTIHSVPNTLPAHLNTTLIMCHPAVPNNSWQDEIKAAREHEYQWLRSQEFEALLQQCSVRLVRWSDIITAS
jgi:predicted glycoside hydrolase/deacetylase ChbG (UPF0249 family)